jgi:HKD family nuclease
MRPYVQVPSQPTTLDHWKQMLAGNELSSFAAFAYVTDSGVAQVGTHLSGHLGPTRHCRWLFGFDYGRSHPTALRALAKMGNFAIRIHDGEYVVQSKSFVPRVSYHLKTALTLHPDGSPNRQMVGSGNLSASGLTSGIEAGCVVDFDAVDQEHGTALMTALEEMWDLATPLEDVIEEYAQRYVAVTQPRIFTQQPPNAIETATLFWIDVGYVTKNRGAKRPGNQFDLPRGAHTHLGVGEVTNPLLNSILGDLRIKTPTGDIIERRLRFGNNAMEKLTLPIPEQYGYECYDGKILTFRLEGQDVLLEAFEHDDFFQIYGMHISSCSEMQSGRKYGTISLPY